MRGRCNAGTLRAHARWHRQRASNATAFCGGAFLNACAFALRNDAPFTAAAVLSCGLLLVVVVVFFVFFPAWMMKACTLRPALAPRCGRRLDVRTDGGSAVCQVVSGGNAQGSDIVTWAGMHCSSLAMRCVRDLALTFCIWFVRPRSGLQAPHCLSACACRRVLIEKRTACPRMQCSASRRGDARARRCRRGQRVTVHHHATDELESQRRVPLTDTPRGLASHRQSPPPKSDAPQSPAPPPTDGSRSPPLT